MRRAQVAVCDSNVDPRLVTYPIPGNDDSPSALRLYLRLFREAILAGARRRERLLADPRNRAAFAAAAAAAARPAKEKEQSAY